MAATSASAFVMMPSASTFVMMPSAVASAVIAAIAAVASAVAPLAAQLVEHVLYLVVGSVAVLQHSTFKLQGFSSQWMVEVHFHLISTYLKHTSVESVAILIL